MPCLLFYHLGNTDTQDIQIFMNYNHIRGIIFSPTGGTKKIVNYIGQRLSQKWDIPYLPTPYTLPTERDGWKPIQQDELVVWGSPVYAGRIPNKTLDFVKQYIKGYGNQTVIVSVYGGRNFDDALAEMCGIAEAGGLTPIAATAVVSRHVFSDTLSHDRPNTEDLHEIDSFCEHICFDHHNCLNIPGNKNPQHYYQPLKEDLTPAKFLKALPLIDKTKCTQCGKCCHCCPTGIIQKTESIHIEGICIKCQACTTLCPTNAIAFHDPDFLSHVKMLEQNYGKDCRNAYFT